MGHETILYGRILGANGNPDNWYKLYQLNKEIIDSLPAESDWPPLVKDIFTSPLTSAGPFFYRAQVIHFGASFKNFDDSDLASWIAQFEDMLRKMYWWNVVVHFDIELYGKYEFSWTASDKAIAEMRSAEPKPVSDWTFEEKRIN